MANSFTTTVGTTDYTFDWVAQKITIENLVTDISAANLKQAIGDAQDEVIGIPFDPIADFFNPVTLTPTSKTFLNVVLRDQWRIDSFSSSGVLTVGGGNVVNVNNGIDIFSANANVSFINNTSAAGVLVTGGGSGLSAGEQLQLSDVHGGVVREIWLDTSLGVNGNGYQQSPYNNLTSAIDDGEANGVTSLVVLDDVTLDRNLKNFSVRGIGVPTIDLAGFTLTGCKFTQVKLEGNYADQIIAQECVLLLNMYLNGYFEKCSMAGDLFCVPGGDVFMTGCGSSIPGLGRPTITMSSGGARVLLSVRDNNGGMTIKGCTHVDDEVTIEVNRGSLTFDASNTAGVMVARTTGKFVDATAGSTVTNENYTQESWQANKMDPDNPVETDEDGTIRVAGKTIGASTVGTTPNRTTTQTRTG
jgi:hypothetical protein